MRPRREHSGIAYTTCTDSGGVFTASQHHISTHAARSSHVWQEVDPADLSCTYLTHHHHAAYPHISYRLHRLVCTDDVDTILDGIRHLARVASPAPPSAEEVVAERVRPTHDDRIAESVPISFYQRSSTHHIPTPLACSEGCNIISRLTSGVIDEKVDGENRSTCRIDAEASGDMDAAIDDALYVFDTHKRRFIESFE